MLELLLQLTAQLTDDRPLQDFLKAVTDATLDLLVADHARIRLLDPSRSMLLSGARSGMGERDHPMEFRRGEGVLGRVIEHHRSNGRAFADSRCSMTLRWRSIIAIWFRASSKRWNVRAGLGA